MGMIVVLYGALAAASVTWLDLDREAPARRLAAVLAVVALVGLPALGLMIRLLDRPSLFRDWLSTVLMNLFLPILTIVQDARAIDQVLHRGQPLEWLRLVSLGFLNLYLLWFLVVEAPKLWPRICPNCGRRGQVPADHDRWRNPYTPRRCASCGHEVARKAPASGPDPPEVAAASDLP